MRSSITIRWSVGGGSAKRSIGLPQSSCTPNPVSRPPRPPTRCPGCPRVSTGRGPVQIPDQSRPETYYVVSRMTYRVVVERARCFIDSYQPQRNVNYKYVYYAFRACLPDAVYTLTQIDREENPPYTTFFRPHKQSSARF